MQKLTLAVISLYIPRSICLSVLITRTLLSLSSFPVIPPSPHLLWLPCLKRSTDDNHSSSISEPDPSPLKAHTNQIRGPRQAANEISPTLPIRFNKSLDSIKDAIVGDVGWIQRISSPPNGANLGVDYHKYSQSTHLRQNPHSDIPLFPLNTPLSGTRRLFLQPGRQFGRKREEGAVPALYCH